MRQDGENYWIFDGDGKTPSGNRLYLDRALISPQSGYLLTHGISLNIGLDPASTIRVTLINPHAGNIAVANLQHQTISLKQKTISLGRDASCTMQLDAPTISRTHATISKDGAGRYILRDLSTNGVFVNGQRVSKSAIVSDGTTIRIGPFTTIVRNDELQLLDTGDRIRLDVDRVMLETRGKRRLDNLSFALELGHLVM